MKFTIEIDWNTDDLPSVDDSADDHLLESAMDVINDAISSGCVCGELSTMVTTIQGEDEEVYGWWNMTKEI